MLVLRAWMRSIALLGLDRGGSSVSMLCRIVGDSPLIWTLGRRKFDAATVLSDGLATLDFVSHNSMQSSVRLRHKLSALRRTCRSEAPLSTALDE
jgi:hypothetical protein